MTEVVVRIPKDLEEEFKGVKPIFWQLAVDKAINEELKRLVGLKRIVSKSKLTERDVKELSDKINESLADRYGQMFSKG